MAHIGDTIETLNSGDLYHQDVLGLAQSIMGMWFWDPDTGFRFPPFQQAELDIARNGGWPPPYSDPSRDNTRFEDYRGERFPDPRLSPSGSTLHKTSRPIIPTDVEYNQDDGLYAAPKEGNLKQEVVVSEDTWEPFNSDTSGCSSSSQSKIIPKLPDYAPQSPFDVEAWRRQVSCSMVSNDKDIELRSTPFVKGLDTHHFSAF
ncbi:hypothetical protein BT96DRAFT_924069 [Gymnopus androsaceus JB14]|uniref:Uncharacterized protein n=1 Tax=Gymnopus androsaceus JB14 TaxID=1447944 RepID=A0A6A4H6P1_9AGAR|nr:hypothetical protein BT96DRAFT_924069 [Gymnopus androsaceus JB14]